jgi:hypothetical protein
VLNPYLVKGRKEEGEKLGMENGATKKEGGE